MMPRFVILRHETPAGYVRGLHWDLMLECNETLRTWALTGEPQWGQSVEAEQLADHRLAYLDFEGEVAGGRGTVSRWDAGTFRWMKQEERTLVAKLYGERGEYVVTLERQANDEKRWTILFRDGPDGGV